MAKKKTATLAFSSKSVATKFAKKVDGEVEFVKPYSQYHKGKYMNFPKGAYVVKKKYWK